MNTQNKRKSTFKMEVVEKNELTLKVDSIELENFKSYFGKNKIGPFDQSFSAVVGPNGSGKSNLLESLIFIFGHRASKMRLKKLTELIHNSNDHPACNFASVSVNFYEADSSGDRHEPFTIKRTIFKESGNTKYYLNNGEVKQQDIIKLLMSKGVDLVNNRFMILQGEVEQIASMDPKGKNADNPGLLEYLEEIIGSNKNVPQILEMEQKIEELIVEKTEKSMIYYDSQKSLDSMDQHKQQVFAMLTINKQILCVEHLINSYKLNSITKERRQKEEELKKQERGLLECEENIR